MLKFCGLVDEDKVTAPLWNVAGNEIPPLIHAAHSQDIFE